MIAHHQDFIDPETKRPWRVRFVRKGDRYGLNHCKTHEEVEALVEVYDREEDCQCVPAPPPPAGALYRRRCMRRIARSRAWPS